MTVPDALRGPRQLDPAARAALRGACAGIVHVPADADLVRQGEAPDRLHVLVEGWACRSRLLDDGRRQIPALHLPGDACDLDGLGGGPLPYAVVTLTRCEVAVWPHRALARAAEEHPGLATALLRLALAENALATQATAVLARLTARERVAHLLCELVARLGATGRAGPEGCDVPLTQDEVADAVGLSTVHVNRVVQGLRADGLIRLVPGRLLVLDAAGLREAGRFRPDHLRLGPDGLGLFAGLAA